MRRRACRRGAGALIAASNPAGVVAVRRRMKPAWLLRLLVSGLAPAVAAVAPALVMTAAIAGGCAGAGGSSAAKKPGPLTPAADCRDLCQAGSCPAGTTCTIAPGCARRCEPEQIAPAR